MKASLRIAGLVLAALGLVWVLQGINVLPGSFMTGHIEWAWRGGVCVAVGVVLVVLAQRAGKG